VRGGPLNDTSARPLSGKRFELLATVLCREMDMLVLPTLRGYKAAWLAADAIAGLTLVAIAIPEQMATAHLANMPAMAGFYAFIAGSVLFAVLGRHPRMSVGADSTITPVFVAGVATVAATGSRAYAPLVSATALVVGGLLIAVGLLRLGWVADFFPLPVVSGVLAGIGVEILVKQLPTVLGLPGGGTTTVGRARAVIDQLGQTNGWAIGIAAGVLAAVVIAEKIDHRIPGALLGVVGATLLVGLAGLASHGAHGHGVHVVERINAALPSMGLPSVSVHQLGKLMATAITVAFLCIVQTSATVRSSQPAREAGKPQVPSDAGARPEDFDIDLVAVGAGSVLAGLSGSFAVNASPPRTAVVGSAGGKSQVASLVAVGAVVAVIAFATSLLQDLPEAALGAILIFVASRLFRARELRSILRFGWFEFALALITLVIVVFLGIEQGVVAAALLALAQRTRLAARPHDALLGREPGTDHWIQTDIGQATEQVEGVVVYLLYAPLWYGNATHVMERARHAVRSAPSPAHTLVLDANGMSDVDYTGAKALAQLVRQMHGDGVTVDLARTSHLVHHDLKHGGLLELIGPDHLFASVDEAVRASTAAASSPAAGSQGPSPSRPPV
jgi:MFS superfamily sulfate permease-like transporter